MKREHPEKEDNIIMFPNLHHQQHPTTSDENDSRLTLPPPPPQQPPQDGGTIEVVRRPRGRPPGSKNKPKPPLIINSNDSSEPPMAPYVLEIPPGADVVVSTTHFCRKRNIGLCILNGHGLVSNVTLKQPATSNENVVVTFHGRFELLSISATISDDIASNTSLSFGVSLAGPHGQVIGGVVVGPLIAAGTVYLIAASFNNPTFHRLMTAVQDDCNTNNNIDEEEEQQHSQPGGDHHMGFNNSNSNNMYPPSSNINLDVVWPPTGSAARPPHYSS